MATVRICVCGDEHVGKSSLITALVKDSFVTTPIQPVLPAITLPPSLGTPSHITTVIVDTSSLPAERATLNRALQRCNVILLVYADGDPYSYERVGLFWMSHFRSLGVNVPVVLACNKADRAASTDSPARETEAAAAATMEEEMRPLLAEFRELDACLRTSARTRYNVNEAFFLCQKAVTHPVAPLFDAREGTLKPIAAAALRRIFYLSDRDRDGVLSDEELQAFQMRCFGSTLGEQDLVHIKRRVGHGTDTSGIDVEGFLRLQTLFVEKGRHETVWIILRAYQYSDSLSLNDSFLHPKFSVPAGASTELSPAGFQFFLDLFLRYDRDSDGGLNAQELNAVFAPTPGLPAAWREAGFPATTMRNEAGAVSLQGWLAQWSMTAFIDPRTTLAYLAYLGFEASDARHNTTSALTVTKARRTLRRGSERAVVSAYVVGAQGSGKSAILDSFLAQPFVPQHTPTTSVRTVVNSVELPGGRQCYLILSEIPPGEAVTLLANADRMNACDLVVYAYDSSDPDSFGYLTALRDSLPSLDRQPALYVACKADRDKVTQRTELQPDAYTAQHGYAPPLHISITWASRAEELFVRIAEAARMPATALSKREGDDTAVDWLRWGILVGVAVAVGGAAAAMWKRLGSRTGDG